MSKPQSKAPAKTNSPAPLQRRGFLTTALAIVCSGLVAVFPIASGLVVFFDPLRRKSKNNQFIRVASLDLLPDDGIPRQFPVIAEREDAWNRSLEPIGAVYLRREPGKETPECWTATCPHAGCFVNYDGGSNTFKCPCHNSTFTVDGAIIEPSPCPRPMDTLECKVADQGVLVKFENFYTGKTDKVAKG